MTELNEYEKDLAAYERNGEVGKQLKIALELVGWKVVSSYMAKRGSLYFRLERLVDGSEWKLRISDHEEQSENHLSPDFQLLCLKGKCGFDFADIANEIEKRGSTGEGYTEFEGE